MVARADVRPVSLPEQECECASVGGDGKVLVRGMDALQQARYFAARRRLTKPVDDETQDDANQRAGTYLVPMVLSICVLADDGEPVYSEKDWAAWFASHVTEGIELFNIATGISGTDPSAEKKS